MARRRRPKIKRPRGRVPGIPVPATSKAARANRLNGWKHGRYARSVTLVEARTAQLAKINPQAPALVQAVFDAVQGGTLEKMNQVGAQALVETEIIRRAAVDRIQDDGVVVQDAMIDKDGNEIGHRLKAHPLFEPLRHMQDTLGFTAAEMRVTNKSRGEGSRDDAITAMLERRAELCRAQKHLMPPPPEWPREDEPIEAEVVERVVPGSKAQRQNRR